MVHCVLNLFYQFLMYLKYICIYGEEQVVRLNLQVGVSNIKYLILLNGQVFWAVR